MYVCMYIYVCGWCVTCT